jgi:isopenicillin N synthase-like dioxygenase
MPSGEWLDVPYIPGSFAVNSGDIRWTNSRFKSTPHRALPPVGQHRYAIPFCLGPQFDWLIACLPTCTGPHNPPRFWYDANYDPKAQSELVA